MKPVPLAAALAFLLLAPLPFAASPLEAFLAHSFEPDSGVASAPLLADGNYYLVSAGGNETYVVDAGTGGTVAGIAALVSLLEQDAKNRDGFEAKVSSAKAFPSIVNEAKMANEAKCLQYIGDDSDPGCIDRQTCIVSCFSSPQCQIIIQSDGFLESAMDWDFRRKDFASALVAYSQGLDAIRFDERAIDSKTSILSNLSSLAENMSQNGIFLTKDDPGCSGKNATLRCYEYCPRIDYSARLISAQAQNLASLKGTISKISDQRARAEAIAARSAENDAYLSMRGREYEGFRIGMVNGIRSLKAAADALAKDVLDPQIAPKITELENISERAKNHSDAGLYKQALALRPDFESLSNATSERISADNASYSGFMLGMEEFSGKVKSSAWLIGNQSASAHLAQLASLKANYSAPLPLPLLSAANAELSEMDAALSSEISSKAVQAGNATQPPAVPQAPQPPLAIPDFAWIAAIALAAVLVYSFLLRAARRAQPSGKAPPPSTQ